MLSWLPVVWLREKELLCGALKGRKLWRLPLFQSVGGKFVIKGEIKREAGRDRDVYVYVWGELGGEGGLKKRRRRRLAGRGCRRVEGRGR